MCPTAWEPRQDGGMELAGSSLCQHHLASNSCRGSEDIGSPGIRHLGSSWVESLGVTRDRQMRGWVCMCVQTCIRPQIWTIRCQNWMHCQRLFHYFQKGCGVLSPSEKSWDNSTLLFLTKSSSSGPPCSLWQARDFTESPATSKLPSTLVCDQLWGTSLNPINSVLPWLHRRLQTLSAVITLSSLHLNTHIHAHTQANHNHRVQEYSLFRPFEKEKHTKSPVKHKNRERNGCKRSRI